MAKLPISEELDALIEQYLTDGVLTDKERAVILKKAVGMGLDHDEIDLYLDAQVQKIDQATDAATRKQKGKTCPFCGGSVPLLTDKCPHCGENITVEASQELQEIFDNLEEALIDLKTGKDLERNKATVERYSRKAKMYYGSNPKVQKLLSEIENETIEAEQKAKNNARKNTILNVLQLIFRHKKFIVGLVIVLVPFFYIMSYLSETDQTRKQCEQQYKMDKPRIDEQYELLTNGIEALDIPDKSNYKEMTSKLLNLVWVDISEKVEIRGEWVRNEYEVSKRNTFVKMKRAYADQLDAIYHSVYRGDSYYDNTPDLIRCSFDIHE